MQLPELDRWFRRIKREFAHAAKRFIGKPCVYVEVGCWAGASAEWVCKNILTKHPDCRGFGVDPYDGLTVRRRHDNAEVRRIAHERIEATKVVWNWIQEPSHVGLIDLRDWLGVDSIDLLYLDGLHEANSVLMDFCLAWPLLKVGSVVIMDDFKRGVTDKWPHVKEAVEVIEIAFKGLVKPLNRNRQASFEVIRKEQPSLSIRRAKGPEEI